MHTKVDLLGLPFDAITEALVVEEVVSAIHDGQGGWIVTVNLDILRQLASSRAMQKLIYSANLLVADGQPLVWAARLQGTPLPERVAGSNLVSSLSMAAGKHGFKVFLLGGAPGSAEKAARILSQRCPGLNVAGLLCPPYGFEQNEEAWVQIESALRDAQPHIVFVGLGFPKQEGVIERMRVILPHSWWIGVGISFSYLSGDITRAPKYLHGLGLEWVYRLLQEPHRLGKRYLLHDIPFAIRLHASSAWRGLRKWPRD